MLRVTLIERQKWTREKSSPLRTRIWAIRWQWLYLDAHPNVELFTEHCTTGAGPHNYDSFLMASTECSRRVKNHELKTHNRSRELQKSTQGKHFISHPVPAASPRFPDPGPSVQAQPPSSSSATPRLGSGELFHFWGPQMNSTILCWIVSCSNISWSILSPATCTSKHRNEYVPVKYIWQGFTAHCLVAGHTLYTGKHSSCFPMALLQAQMQQGWCQGSAGLGLLCNSSISLSSRRGEQTPTQAKLDNSSPRFHFKAQATRAGYFYWCYQSISKTADSREKCKQDFKLATLSKLTLPPPSCTLNKYTIKH